MKFQFSIFNLIVLTALSSVLLLIGLKIFWQHYAAPEIQWRSRPLWILSYSIDRENWLGSEVSADLFQGAAKWHRRDSKLPPISCLEAIELAERALNCEDYCSGVFKNAIFDEKRCSIEGYDISRSERVHFWVVRSNNTKNTDFEHISVVVLMDGNVLDLVQDYPEIKGE